MEYVDDDGQPSDIRWNAKQRNARSTDELIGLIKGIVADGSVNRKESDALAAWCVANADEYSEWPITAVVDRLERIYADGVVTEEELVDLQEFLGEVVGNGMSLQNQPSPLALTEPAPEVIFDQNKFVLTGKFALGTRRYCEEQITKLGGICLRDVRADVNYLVIGSYSSRDWKHSTFGNKIEKAVDYCQRYGLAIIGEEHWHSYVTGRVIRPQSQRNLK